MKAFTTRPKLESSEANSNSLGATFPLFLSISFPKQRVFTDSGEWAYRQLLIINFIDQLRCFSQEKIDYFQRFIISEEGSGKENLTFLQADESLNHPIWYGISPHIPGGGLGRRPVMLINRFNLLNLSIPAA